jgi:hypothetical protein
MGPEKETSGATNEIGAPETGFCGSKNQVLTPRDNDLSPVLGHVVAARAVDYHLLRDETTCVAIAIELRCTDVRLKADTTEARAEPVRKEAGSVRL